jgi:acetate kinase
MPEASYMYAIPYQYYRRHRIRRYGFHGSSHQYLAGRYATLAGIAPDEVNIITLHLGNGCSACAIRGGESFTTSMGFTPLEGLVMGTRSGDVDPSLVEFLMRTRPRSGRACAMGSRAWACTWMRRATPRWRRAARAASAPGARRWRRG